VIEGTGAFNIAYGRWPEQSKQIAQREQKQLPKQLANINKQLNNS
jgi:hypothetical protein